MTRTAAVTGATGFLGSHLCAKLLADGWTVRGLTRPSSDRTQCPDEIEWYVGDLFATETLESLVADTDAVFHLAGVSLWNADDDTVFRVNVDGTKAVVDACNSHHGGRLVFASTAGTRRTSENGVIADESDVAPPVGAYQASKARAESIIDAYVGEGGDAVTVHPTSIFGPRDEKFTTQVLAMALDPTRFVYLPGGLSVVGVADVVDGIVAACDHGKRGAHYILGGENFTYDRLLSRIAAVTDGHPAPIRIPATAIHAAGPVAETVHAVTDQRVFPFDRRMAQLATQRLFYTSRKAHDHFGYTYEPIESHVPAAVEWYETL